MKTFIRFYLCCILLLFVYSAEISNGQTFQTQLVNNGAMYATASILQDYDNDGDLDIIVTRRSGLNDDSPSSVILLENDGTALFPKTTLFEELIYPVDVDAEDFDNDGDIDYIVTDKGIQSNEGRLLLFTKQSDGSFSSQIIVENVSLDQTATADFNNDGNTDIVAVGFWQDTVNVFLNDGSLNFSPMVLAEDVSGIDLVEVSDIDEDNDIDIVMAGSSSYGFKLFYNNGSGLFDSTKNLYTTNGNYSSADRGIIIDDINNDGVKDIVTFSGVGFGGLYFLDGSSGFSPSLIDIDNVDLGGDIVAADFDGNGLKDIIRQNTGDDYVRILYQDSTLFFRSEFIEKNWDNRGSGQMSVGDLDGDNDPDLVFPENGNVDGDISWFENMDGKLYRHYLYHEISGISLTKAADIDRDGDLDILATAGGENTNSAISENEIVWYQNVGNSQFIESRIEDEILFPGDLAMGDVNNDNNFDFIATGQNDGKITWYERSNRDWTKTVLDSVGYPTGAALTDLNSDNNIDLVICSTGDSILYLYTNDGTGNFSREVLDPLVYNPQKVISDDFNNDGIMDLAVSSSDTSNTLIVYLNEGDGNFEKTILAKGQASMALESVDWDGDQDRDIFAAFDKGSAAGQSIRDLALFLNDGQGNFTDSTFFEDNERTNVITIADIDSDNDPDLIFGNGFGNYPLRLLVNDGNSSTVKV